jgi:CRP-like cAMP-binding protein
MQEAIAKKIDTFFHQFRQQTYKKRQIIIRADEDPTGILYLKEGIVKKYAISQKGDELVVNLFKPVSFFPMSWALIETPNNYYYEAVTDVVVWKAPKDKVIMFVKQNPDVLFDLMCRVYTGTEGMLTRMTYLMAGNAYARLLTELIIQAKRFGKQQADGKIMIKVSEKELAAQSGMTRETVSREMKTVKEKGLIVTEKGQLLLTDIASLEEELSDGV